MKGICLRQAQTDKRFAIGSRFSDVTLSLSKRFLLENDFVSGGLRQAQTDKRYTIGSRCCDVTLSLSKRFG